MSKNEETNMLIECVTKLKGKGMAIDNTVFLADIAKSLAMIADKLYMEESKVCKVESSVDVLDEMRDEFISLYPKNYAGEPELGGISCVFSLNKVLKIIDKYKAESEDKTNES